MVVMLIFYANTQVRRNRIAMFLTRPAARTRPARHDPVVRLLSGVPDVRRDRDRGAIGRRIRSDEPHAYPGVARGERRAGRGGTLRPAAAVGVPGGAPGAGAGDARAGVVLAGVNGGSVGAN